MVEIARIPKDITKYYIPDSVFNNTVSHLRKVGDSYKEGIAYWSGVLDKNEAHITRTIFADNYPEFQNEERFARVSLDAALKIGEEIHKNNEILFAQIHTHPAKAFHSFVDDEYPISHRIGFVSIVIPNFAQNITSLSKCKVFEYLGKARWSELSHQEAIGKFVVGEKRQVNSRHDRTEIFLQDYISKSRNFFSTPIMITANAEVLNTSNGRMMLESVINLTSRFVDKLDIKIPDSHANIASSMKKLATTTGCKIEDDENFEPRIVLSVGPTDIKSELTIQINSSGWVSYISCNSDVDTFSANDENPIGALGAACFGAAEVFKKLLEINGCKKNWAANHPGQTCFSFLDYAFSSNNMDFPRKVNIEKILLVGAGAVGSGFLYAISKIENLRGNILVLDHDGIDRTNLNRCLPYFVDDVGKPKVKVCERLSNDKLSIFGHSVRYDSFQKQENEFPLIVSTVDNDDARFAIQHDLPKLIFHAATGKSVSAVSVIKLLENACLCCIFENETTHEEVISNETGIPVDVVTNALTQKLPFTEEHYRFMYKKLQNTAIPFRDMIGKPFEDVYKKEICGTISVETNDGKKTPSVPFVSFFSGLCVAAELIKYHSKSFKELPMMNRLDFLQMNLFTPNCLLHARRVKNPKCTLGCSDKLLQKHFLKKWS